MGTTVLVRPDGSTLRVKDEDVPSLQGLGYREQSLESERAGTIQGAGEDYYHTGTQRALTLVQGIGSGASFGLSDLGDDEDDRMRARFNPGYRIGGELLGGFIAPVGPIGDAAEAAGAGRFLRGAAEGTAFGAGGAITEAKLNGDPLTAEAVLAGAGWGSLWGGGLTSIFGAGSDLLKGTAGRAEREAISAAFEPGLAEKAHLERAMGDAKVATALSEGAADRAATIDGLGDRHYREFKSTVDDARSRIGASLETVGKTTEAGAAANIAELGRAPLAPGEEFSFNQPPAAGGAADISAPRYTKEFQWSKGDNYDRMPKDFEGRAPGSNIRDGLLQDVGGLAGRGPTDDILRGGTGLKPFAETADPMWGRLTKHSVSPGTLDAAEFEAKYVSPGKSAGPGVPEAPPSPNPNFSDLKASNNVVYNWLTAGGAINEVRDTARNAQRAMRAAQKAGYEGNFEKMSKYLEEYKGHVETMGAHFGQNFPAAAVMPQVDELLTFAKDRFTRASTSADTLGTLHILDRELAGLPKDTEGFMAMTGPKIEKMSAALDSLQKLPAAEFAGVKAAVDSALEKWSERLGVSLEGEGTTTGSAFRKLQETLKDVGKSKSLDEAKRIANHTKAWADVSKAEERYLSERGSKMFEDPKAPKKRSGAGSALAFGGGLLAEGAAHKAGAHGFMRYGAYVAGKHAVSALLGLKGAVMGHLADAVKKWGPRAAAVLDKVPATRIEPLARRLHGELETEHKSKIELMNARAEEIRSAAPTVRDVLYRNVAPIGVEHPELASAMHELAAQQFAFLLNKLPQDPGGAYSQLKTLWKPDLGSAMKFERYYAVFHDPVGEVTSALKSGKVTPELTEGLREMYPQLYSEMKADMIMRLADPRVWKSMNYSEQVNLGLLMGFPVHSTMRPSFVAAQSQMFKERNDPQGIKPQAGAQGGGGRPPGPASPSATASQRITEH